MVLRALIALGIVLAASSALGQDAAGSDAPTRPAWRGSQLAWGHHVTKNTLAPASQLTHNPTYLQSLILAPRWYVREDLSLRLRQDFVFELTEPDAQNDRFLAQDTVLDAVYAGELGDDWVYAFGPRLTLPLSVVSQAARRLLGAGARAALVYQLPDVLEGAALEASGNYVHYFARSNVPATESRELCATAGVGGSGIGYFYCSGGSTSVRDRAFLNLEAGAELVPRLTLSLSFGWIWQYGHGLAGAEVPTLTGDVELEDGSQTHFRNSTIAAISIGYELGPGIELALGADSGTSQLSPNGEMRDPLLNPETQFSLSLTLQPDAWQDRPPAQLSQKASAESGTP